jgi:nuclear GTP-binding protein
LVRVDTRVLSLYFIAVDLVPKEVTQQWLKYLRRFFPCIAFKSSTQTQKTHLGHVAKPSQLLTQRDLNKSECIGAEELMQLLKNYCRNQKLKTAITVGVIGYPNVGKSSLINSLKRSRVCGVGQMPGFTRNIQEISLDKQVKLLDSPGIVFSQGSDHENAAEAVLRNCVKVELLDDPIPPTELILQRCAHDQLQKIYQVHAFADTQDFLVQVARKRGRLRKVHDCCLQWQSPPRYFYHCD